MTIENWKEEFEVRFNRRHSQMTHIGDKENKRSCDVCNEDREKNPKGYYLTYLHEQKCYWNRELYEEVLSFIESLLTAQATEVIGKLEALKVKPQQYPGPCPANQPGCLVYHFELKLPSGGNEVNSKIDPLIQDLKAFL